MTNTKQVDKYKAHFKQTLDREGDKIGLKLIFNRHLGNLLKNCIIDDTTPFNCFLGKYKEDGEREFITYKRYLVKRVLYSSLYKEFKECLFIKDLVDKNEYTFYFTELDKLEHFKECIRQNIFSLIKCFLSSELEQTIVYNIKTEE